jgi:hypothetical protein
MKTFFFAAVLFGSSLALAGSTTVKKTTTVTETTTNDRDGKATTTEETTSGSSGYSRGQVGIELFGAGIVYSIFGSFRFHQNFAANVGFSFFNGYTTNSSGTANVDYHLLNFPVSISALLGGPNSNFELLAGGLITIVNGTQSSSSTLTGKLTGGGFAPTFGAGFRYWPLDGGFHFRATAYAFLISSSLYPSLGLSFGYAF